MANTAEEHFEQEPPHTAIKHKLFKSVFESCISISSSFNNKDNEKRKFMYLDLYAGCGKFKDENLGSPLIALSCIKNQIENPKNNINKIAMVLSEQNNQNALELSSNVDNFINENNLSDYISAQINSDSWESCTGHCSQVLNTTQWGIIFADPFSVELKLPDLIKLISQNIYFKDILILINTNAHERILGREDDDSLQKISDYFGIELKMLRMLKKQVKDVEKLNNAVVVRRLIKRAFRNINKDFIINLAITRSREGELENADRFYLCLITSSVGVANAYLDTYSNLLNEKAEKKADGQRSLFDDCEEIIYFELSKKIKEIVLNKKLSLLKLISNLFNDFYSWKNASSTEIPTTKNIQKAINLLVEQKCLKILCDNETKDKYLNKTGEKLTSKVFQNKKNLKKIYVESL